MSKGPSAAGSYSREETNSQKEPPISKSEFASLQSLVFADSTRNDWRASLVRLQIGNGDDGRPKTWATSDQGQSSGLSQGDVDSRV